MSKQFKFISETAGQRLDVFLSAVPELQELGLSRSQIKHLVENELVSIDGKAVSKSGVVLKEGMTIFVQLPAASEEDKSAYDFELDIIYEDKDLIVINKQAGLTVHPGANTSGNTLLNALIAHYQKKNKKLPEVFNSNGRGGIVHRLDKDTTGLMVCAKNIKTLQSLSKQFADRSIDRLYHALVFSTPKATRPITKSDTGEIDLPIGRDPKRRIAMGVGGHAERQAKTIWQVIERFDYATLVELKLMTGRTHQIRVHMNAIGSPVIGDRTYGEFSGLPLRLQQIAEKFGRQALHARRLGFIHPVTEEQLCFDSELPADFVELIKSFS